MTESILLQNLSIEQLSVLMGEVVKTQLDDFKKEFATQSANDDLMTREQTLDFLQINASTLWHWQNKGRIIAYKFGNKCYYKRSELMDSLIIKK